MKNPEFEAWRSRGIGWLERWLEREAKKCDALAEISDAVLEEDWARKMARRIADNAELNVLASGIVNQGAIDWTAFIEWLAGELRKVHDEAYEAGTLIYHD